MSRSTLETLIRLMDAAYRSDRFHALRANLESVRRDEWDVRPAGWSAAVFGTDPVLSIGEIVEHVAAAKFMYADRAFGDASVEWSDIEPPSREMDTMLGWLDDGHRALRVGLAALADDAELERERPAPWRAPLRRAQLISIVINHDLYHAGEINRQRSLIRGSEGWQR